MAMFVLLLLLSITVSVISSPVDGAEVMYYCVGVDEELEIKEKDNTKVKAAELKEDTNKIPTTLDDDFAKDFAQEIYDTSDL